MPEVTPTAAVSMSDAMLYEEMLQDPNHFNMEDLDDLTDLISDDPPPPPDSPTSLEQKPPKTSPKTSRKQVTPPSSPKTSRKVTSSPQKPRKAPPSPSLAFSRSPRTKTTPPPSTRQSVIKEEESDDKSPKKSTRFIPTTSDVAFPEGLVFTPRSKSKSTSPVIKKEKIENPTSTPKEPAGRKPTTPEPTPSSRHQPEKKDEKEEKDLEKDQKPRGHKSRTPATPQLPSQQQKGQKAQVKKPQHQDDEEEEEEDLTRMEEEEEEDQPKLRSKTRSQRKRNQSSSSRRRESKEENFQKTKTTNTIHEKEKEKKEEEKPTSSKEKKRKRSVEEEEEEQSFHDPFESSSKQPKKTLLSETPLEQETRKLIESLQSHSVPLWMIKTLRTLISPAIVDVFSDNLSLINPKTRKSHPLPLHALFQPSVAAQDKEDKFYKLTTLLPVTDMSSDSLSRFVQQAPTLRSTGAILSAHIPTKTSSKK